MTSIINLSLFSMLMILSVGCEPLPPYQLEQIFDHGGYWRYFHFNGSWISPNEISYGDWGVGILTYNVETQKKSIILDRKILSHKGGGLNEWTHSADLSYALIGYRMDWRPQKSYQFFRKFDVLNVKTGKRTKIADGEPILMAEWSTVGNGFIYEMKNDLYYGEIDGNDRVVTRRLTTDGVAGGIKDAVPDWNHRGNSRGDEKFLWFSPDGKHVAFVTINDTEVEDISSFWYDTTPSKKFPCPTHLKYKYSKAGAKNPRVSLNLLDLTDPNSKLITLKAPIDIVSQDHIIHEVNWLTNESVAAFWTNRVQNIAQLVTYDIHGKSNNLLKIEEKKGWIDVPKPILYGNKLVLLKYQETNTTDGRYIHLTSYDLINGSVLKNEKDLTPLRSEVQSFLRIDEKEGKIYYLAAEPGNNCTYVSVDFSTDASHYALACVGPDPGTVDIYNRHHEKVYQWETSDDERDVANSHLQHTKKIVSIDVNGYSCNARMYLPPGFNESLSYPMIVRVNAAPNTLAVTDEVPLIHEMYYTTNRSVILTVIDGRGSAFKGSKMLFEINRGFGTVEIEDQIAVTKKLQERYSWIDSKRTGIWGEVYGGFATAMIMAKDHENIFKCGISLNPVIFWKTYNSFYTERYMGLPTPEDNEAGYKRSDVTRLVEGMRGKKYMLIHAAASTTVFYHQSMILSDSLVHADIEFEQMIYPDEGDRFKGVWPHLAYKMDKFWGECLDLTYAK